jgi:hypothetical protein
VNVHHVGAGVSGLDEILPGIEEAEIKFEE